MAHECEECGMTCHCGGDIDDIHWGTAVNCMCAYSEWGCGKYDDDNFDEDKYHEEQEKLNDLCKKKDDGN